MSTYETVVPRPAQASPMPGTFRLDASTSVGADPVHAPVARWLRGALATVTTWDVPAMDADRATVRLVGAADLDAEGYRLTVAPSDVTIEASDPAGAFYGAQTLRQLLGPEAFRRAPMADAWSLDCVEITDRPRYAWRGAMLDVARHFMPKDYVLRFLDVMAAHKLNVLHLHLTDEQGWRVEIVKYPRLTTVGGWRRQSHLGAVDQAVFNPDPHGGYYSQDDVREIVAYAARLYITVVPEIDVPGHVQAMLAAYPELSVHGRELPVRVRSGANDNVLAPRDHTVGFVCDVLDEVMDLFPGPWVGLGGDEVPTTQWEADPFSRQRAAELGLSGPTALHGWFLGVFADHVLRAGRTPTAWDEVVEAGLPPGVLVTSWRGFDGGVEALRAGHDVVMSPNTVLYLDHLQAEGDDEPIPAGELKTLRHVYEFEALPADAPDDLPGRLLGAQANIWTELMETPRRVDYMAFPRLCALAEAVWTPARRRDYLDFEARLRAVHLRRLDALGVEYRPLDGPHPWQRRPGFRGWAVDESEDRPHQADPASWPHDVQTDAGPALDDVADYARER